MEANLLAMEANSGALMTHTGTLDWHAGDMEPHNRAVDLFRLSLKWFTEAYTETQKLTLE